MHGCASADCVAVSGRCPTASAGVFFNSARVKEVNLVLIHFLHYTLLHALNGFSTSFAGLCCPLTVLFKAVTMINAHEGLQSSQSTWMVVAFVPHIGPGIAKYPSKGGKI